MSSNRQKMLPVALVIFGIAFLLVYPLMDVNAIVAHSAGPRLPPQ